MRTTQVSDELFRRLVESVRDYAIFALDRRGYIISWNDGAERLKGYGRDEVLGRHFSVFYPAADVARDKPGEELRVASAVGRFEDIGWRVRKDGSVFWANVIITAMRDPRTGELTGFSKVTRDLTDQKRSEEVLRQAFRDMESFSYSASHDLRAPLRAILTLAELTLQEPTPLDAEARTNLEAIAKSAQKCAGLVDDLLRFAKASRHTLTRDEIDLNALVHEVADTVRARYPHAVELTIASAEANTRADAPLMRIVLENLLDNAWKYTRQTPAPRVVFGVEPPTDGMRTFFVRDNGAGFDAKRAEGLFEPFHRLHAPEEFSGSGVGLATVRRIVERHGGRVWAQGVQGEGATIFFALPTAA